MKNIIIILTLCIFILSCKKQTSFLKLQESVCYTDSVIFLKDVSTTINDTVYLGDIIEDIKYISLDISNIESLFQLQYTDSLIFASNNDSVFIFTQQGRQLNKIPLDFGCFDISENQNSIYTYVPLNKSLSCYDLSGKRLWTSRLQYKGKDIGTYGHSFVRISDSLFAIAIQNQGFNTDRFILVDKRGNIKEHVANPESFPNPDICYTSHTEWRRTLTRNGNRIFYHPLYGDTIYILNDSMKLEPYIIEQIVKKVPLEARPEYTGNNWKQFEKICRENNFQVTRVFNTLRYVIVEYKLGHISNCISNYWVYDKKEKLLKKTFNNLSESLSKGKAHFGIFNNYDGGLAFAPDFFSNRYLIMVNAGTLQGNKSVYAKQIYSHNLHMMKNKYKYRSDIYQNQEAKKKADDFWMNCDDKKLTLTIVKMKE